jgi:hypothetical protein
LILKSIQKQQVQQGVVDSNTSEASNCESFTPGLNIFEAGAAAAAGES